MTEANFSPGTCFEQQHIYQERRIGTLRSVTCLMVTGPLTMLVAVLVLARGPAHALSPGSLDVSFGSAGIVTTQAHQQALIQQPDGTLVTLGTTLGGNGFYAFVLTRYGADGNLDTSFGSGGTAIASFGSNDVFHGVRALVRQPDGKLVAAGGHDTDGVALARYNPDGSLDANFGTGGTVVTLLPGVDSGGAALVLQPDGKLVVAGSSGGFALVRYNGNGSLDGNFGTGGKVITSGGGGLSRAFSLVRQPDGKLVAAGEGIHYLNTGEGRTAFAVARFNADGSFDGGFGAGGVVINQIGDGGAADDVVLQPDGKLVVIGDASIGGTDMFALARYNADGTLDARFGTGGIITTQIGDSSSGLSLLVQPNGKLVAGGSGVFAGTRASALARYTVDGHLDPTFGTNGKVANIFSGLLGSGVINLVLQPTGRLVASNDTALSRYFDITCGDGVLDLPPEQCDDGNLVNGDGCEANCTYTPVCQSVGAGGSVTSDISGSGANAGFPLQVTVRTPNAGSVCITMPPGIDPAPGFDVLGLQAQITAPPASASSPLIVQFVIDVAQIPPGTDPNSIPILKDGVLVRPCISAIVANPDPCVLTRTFGPTTRGITVLTSTASLWTVAAPTATGCGNGVVEAGEQCDDANTVSGDCCSATCQAEDLGNSTCGVGACQRTTANCVSGVPQACIPGAPGVEGPPRSASCSNGIDDDCDGLTDRDDPDCDSPPDCSAAVASPSTLWPPKHKYAKVSVTGVTDPDGDAVNITITGITQDEPLDSFGDGHTCPDGAGIGTSTALVRAERARSPRNSRDGRVYHVSFTADDGRGKECTGTVAVCVPPHRRAATCVDEGPLLDSTGPCS